MFKEIYKCRLCGEVFFSGLFISGNSKNTDIPIQRIYNKTSASTQHHCCRDHGIGIADFQGYKYHDET